MALECEALALHYEALALSTSGLVLLGLGLDTVGLVNIAGTILSNLIPIRFEMMES